MPEFGDIYVCRFPFTSGTLSKPRPVLVLFDLGVDVLICRITSVSYSGQLDVAVSNPMPLLAPVISAIRFLLIFATTLLR